MNLTHCAAQNTVTAQHPTHRIWSWSPANVKNYCRCCVFFFRVSKWKSCKEYRPLESILLLMDSEGQSGGDVLVHLTLHFPSLSGENVNLVQCVPSPGALLETACSGDADLSLTLTPDLPAERPSPWRLTSCPTKLKHAANVSKSRGTAERPGVLLQRQVLADPSMIYESTNTASDHRHVETGLTAANTDKQPGTEKEEKNDHLYCDERKRHTEQPNDQRRSPRGETRTETPRACSINPHWRTAGCRTDSSHKRSPP